jgi:hypothetical protein
MTENHDRSQYREIEEALSASVPFGDSGYLSQCTWSRYAHRLEMLAEHLPVAKTAAQALRTATDDTKYRVLGDPTVRSSINIGLVHFRLGHKTEAVEEAAKIIQLAQEQLAQNATVPALQAGASNPLLVGTRTHGPWVWTDDRIEDTSSGHFRNLVKKELGPSHLELRSASKQDVEMLTKGARLLSTLLPDLAHSALSHAQLVAMLSHPPGFISVTNPQIPGVLFLSSNALSTPWKAAEYLLHESFHLKFLDIEQTHSLLPQGYQPKDCLVRPPWRRPHSADPYLWPLNRILTVAHVYTALSLFFSVVAQRLDELVPIYGPIGESDVTTTIRKSLDRAEYLASQLQQNEGRLGKAGQYFARWLNEILDTLDPSRRPRGSYLHLIADLYDTEASALARTISRVQPERLSSRLNLTQIGFSDCTVADVLSEMLQNEIRCADELGKKSGQKFQWTESLIQTIARQKQESPAELATLLVKTRALLCQSFEKIPPGHYTSLNEPLVLDDLLLNSSRYVEAARKHLSS